MTSTEKKALTALLFSIALLINAQGDSQVTFAIICLAFTGIMFMFLH